MQYSTHVRNPDVILIGSGIMSANLACMLKRLDPDISIQIYEACGELTRESSDGWNNAGTGHAGICELSYTPSREPDGSVDITKLLEIFEQFEHSRQFWSHAVETGMVSKPEEFINPVPHLSFVHGEEMVDFLKARYEGMANHHFFEGIEFSSDPRVISQWVPLVARGRGNEAVAATKMSNGTDVNFGNVARKLLHWLSLQDGCGIAANHRVVNLKKTGAEWTVHVKDVESGNVLTNSSGFVFVGAGGGSLPLLQKAGIPEAKGLGGFPIGGQWLVCRNQQVVAQHHAKVYGQPLKAAPTMAVPHLDSRILDGKRELLFGPFAAWTTKFLHNEGSYLDLPLSIRPNNVLTLANVGIRNMDLVRYLLDQGTQSMEDRMKVLRVFYPEARKDDWDLIDGGIRVQAIKRTDGKAGIVHYGTEIITDAGKSISALLGASPGASVSVNIVLQVIRQCFSHLLDTAEGRNRMTSMIPAYDKNLKSPENALIFRKMRDSSDRSLKLR